ncbi:GntR family transcriptional regulator [Phytohabitans kaempferiae]
MDIHVSLTGRRDLAAGIYRQLLDAILDGRLRSGERLPPSRDLAQRLEVSRNTVAVAYERLTAEGFLVSRVGAGTYVSTEQVGRLRSRTAPTGSAVRPWPLWRSLAVLATGESTVEYDFAVGVPDAEGIDVAAIPAAAHLVYVTPSHQFPTGTPLSLVRRAALVGWAERRGAVRW